MVLEVIYVVRHGYRSNWNVDPITGTYSTSVRTPTGIPSDPALASYGVLQAKQLGKHLLTLQPFPDKIYSSPYYRCLQTLTPFTDALAESRQPEGKVEVWIEPGLGEFYGAAKFEHPSPARLEELRTHFDNLYSETEPVIIPEKTGETIPQLHDRVAFCLHELIRRADEDPKGPKAILICSHAAAIIAAGRVLTGRMPEDVGEEDFRCFTCGLSKFMRRKRGVDDGGDGAGRERGRGKGEVEHAGWRDGNGVKGGWDCEWNSDCSFLENGEERGWNFWMEQRRIKELEAKDGPQSSTAPAATSGSV